MMNISANWKTEIFDMKYKSQLAVLAALSVLIVLTGCARTVIPADIRPGLACPVEKQYSRAEQRRAARELRACGAKCRQTGAFIRDYGILRKQVRACRGK